MAARSEQGTFLDNVLDATVDTFLAFATVWLVLTVVVTRTTDLVGSPVPEPTLQTAVGIVAVGCTAPFVSGLWSLRHWLQFVHTVVIVFLAISSVGFLVLVPLGGVPTDSTASKLLQFGVVAVALLGPGALAVFSDR